MTPLERRSQASRQLRAYAEPLSDASLAPLSVTMDDFLEAIPRVQPSAKREGFATIPNVTWEDVGALDDVRQELEMAILYGFTCSCVVIIAKNRGTRKIL